MKIEQLKTIDKPKTGQDLPIVEGQEWGNCFVIQRGQASPTYAWFKEGVNLYVAYDKNNKVIGMWQIK